MSAWSRHHDKSQSCGRTDRPHHGRGLCKVCHNEPYRLRHEAQRLLAYGSRRAYDRQAPYRQSAALIAFHHRRLAERGQ